MTDSEDNQPVERKRADPLQVAAEMLAQEESTDERATPGPRHAPESRSHARAEDESDTPRARRAAARAARQEALDKRREERAAAKELSASRRRGDDEQERTKSLAEKLDEAREAVATPPDREELSTEEPTQTITWGNTPTAADFSDEPEPQTAPETAPEPLLESAPAVAGLAGEEVTADPETSTDGTESAPEANDVPDIPERDKMYAPPVEGASTFAEKLAAASAAAQQRVAAARQEAARLMEEAARERAGQRKVDR